MGAAKIAYLSRWVYLKKMGVAQLLKNINRVIYACDISYKAEIKGILELPHQGLGVVIGDGCVIGKNVTIRQNVTLGSKNYGSPVIESHVDIGAGAVILGAITVGEYVSIGANAVVLENIPPYCIGIGVPARAKRINRNLV